MRGVWWSAFALLLIAAASALRTTQVESTSRISRRLPISSRSPSSTSKVEDIVPTFRPRATRRKEETTTRDISRSRSRSRPTEVPSTSTTLNIIQYTPEQNDRFDSKRSNSRPRNRPSTEASFESINKENIPKTKSRQSNRHVTVQSTQNSLPTTTTSLPKVRPEVNLRENLRDSDDFSKISQDNSNQFRRRSSTVRTTEIVTQPRPRTRANARNNIRALDLEVSGTANALTSTPRDQNKTITEDLRNSKKLRYRTRPTETDTNLTGEGVTTTNERRSSHVRESAPSQIETKRFFPTSSENDIKPSTERISLKTSTIKNMKVVKRPLSRGKTTAPILAEKNKVSDEISEDDNYPDSFKALIQAKNASTQASSPSSESLSVNASQKDTNNYTTTTQTIITAPDVEKEAGLRSKLKLEENKKTENRLDPSNLVETTHAPEQIKPRSVEYRLRGSYSSRKQKQSTSTSSTVSSTTANSSTQRAYKFSRKFKTSTEASKIENPIKEKQNGNSDNTLKIPVRRSSLYTRRNVVNKVNLDSQNITEKINVTKSNNLVKYKKILPRTSYYSRSRNNSVNVTSITDKSVQNDKEEVQVASKKIENSVEMPLIYTYLNSPSKESKNENSSSEANEKPTFIIKVNSKESTESGSENELINSVDDSLNKPVTNIVTTTQKYHATYKDDVISESKEKMLSTATPPIRNLQTRKYARKVTRQREEKYSVTPKPRERNLRKYSDTFSKTTEASSNGIIAEPEKPKNKFSSKYRASYLDKPFYKPTVPTVTPSTAWLKFFVTDHLLTEFIEEPKWFNGEEFSDVTTEQMSRQNITSPTCLHETSLERVEGEEIQLGQDINSISFSKTRSPLYSADLRLSESLVKPPQVMNVEASQHSPSVTVSIFDALAEILTSTPKPRISSTTEVLARQININNDAKQTLDGVSSNINVNSVKGLTSQDTFVSTNIINMSAKSVQITEKTTPNVFNRKTVGENVTPALITEEETTFPVNTPLTLPTPFPNLPTTPISARRPFAIKVLYADTEGPTDKMTALPTSTQPTTENSTMVYNTVSDLILSNNRLVSSELTSMLSNNIKSIIQNMDDASKARLSADMVKVLNSLIPKAMNRLTTTQDDTDFLPNTTPYSLEDIKDTQNVFGNDKENLNLDNENILQTVSIRSIVNSTDGLNNELNVTTVATLDVNSTFSLDVTENIMSASSFPNFVTDVPATTENIDSNLSISSRELSKTASLVQTTDANMISITHIDNGLTVSDSINEPDPPVPFLTNFELNDFSNDKITSNISDMVSASTPSSLQAKELEDIDNIQDPSQLSKLQLWILSKKARVLKMIEDLIRNHNEEILNAPLVELVNNSNQNNVTLSTRLTEIVNTMSLTTQSPDINDLTSQAMTNTEVPTLSTNPFPSSFPTTINSITTENSISEQITEETFETTTSQSLLDNASISSAGSVSVSETASDIPNTLSSSTIMSVIATTVDENIRALDDVLSEITTTNIKDMEFTTLQNMGTNTDSGNIDTTTELSTTTEVNSQTTTLSGTEISTDTLLNNTNDVSAVNSQLNVATPSTIPKKDYVIFGILPNNTVVRKDPNDDALETLTEASPYIIYGVLPNNTVIRKFPNGTRVPRIMQKIDILPISPWSLRNPYSPIHNIPAIVRPQSNPIRVSTNTVTSTDTSNNGSENRLTTDTISSSALNIKDSSSLGITTSTIKSPAEKSTASHVLSLRTTTMLPSVDEILLNSISSATKEEMVISSMTSSTREPRILTLDIDPETKQIRTEKPDDGNGNAVFKFIPIDEVTSLPQESNVQKLASTKMPKTTTMLEVKSTVSSRVIESTTQISQNRNEIDSKQATTLGSLESSSPSLNSATLQPETSITMNDITTPFTNVITESITIPTTTTELQYLTTGDILSSTPTSITTTAVPTSTIPTTIETIPTTIRNSISLSTTQSTESSSLSTLQTDVFLSTTVLETSDSNQKNVEILQSSVQDVSRSAKNLDSVNTITETSKSTQNYNAKLLETLLEGGALQIGGTKKVNNENQLQNTTPRSIEEDIRQFEEDTKLLKALLLATGRNPAELNLPNLDNIKTVITPKIPVTMSTTPPTTTTILSTRPTSTTSKITTPSISDDLRKLQEDTKLLQALLQATGNQNNGNLPIISGITSNVRIASNPLTTSIESSPTTTRPSPVFSTITPGTVTISTLQPQPLTTEVIGISTTFRPYNERSTTTIRSVEDLSTISARRAPNSRLTATTEIPSTSTFSDEEDLLFLQNLKSVLSTKNSNEDPETALANRVIALAVERSLNEIQTGTTSRPTTTPRTTTTTTTTTAAPQQNIPSIEEDIRQFEQDTKLLQALLKATGQDPSKFNIPTLPTTNRPDPTTSSIRLTTTPRPYGAKIAVKDDLKNEQDDAKLLQTLIKLQDAQETTTQRSKLAITGQSTDEALKKLLTQAKPTGMVPEATKSSISLSTEYGNSNDALLAALLKEQGFGPTTASSLDEQLRLAALLNQVVVTPKARRTTTPPPPPPAPRRPILDGLAWLWQQWRETAPGSGPPRPERRPAPSARPSITPSAATSSRVNWFGSGPFVGNADERPTSNRIPLEPPSAVTSEQGPGRGQLVSAAINVTRAFSQFLGAAIQGAAQTVQNVIRAGQRVATDAYAPESG